MLYKVFHGLGILLSTWERLYDGNGLLVFLEKSLKGTQLKHVRLICYEECTGCWSTLDS